MKNVLLNIGGVDADVIGGGALQAENKKITNRLISGWLFF